MPDAGPPNPGRLRRRSAKLLGRLVPDGNPSSMVYGTILTASLLAVESDRSESLPEAALSVTLAVLVLYLAKTYSAALGDRLHRPAPWTARHLAETAIHELSLLQGAAAPVSVLIVASLAGVSDHVAVIAALVSAIVVLAVLELAAAVASDLGPAALVSQAAATAAMGAGVLGLKVIAH